MAEDPAELAPSTRVIHAVFDLLAARRRAILAALAVLVLAAVLAEGIYVVKKEERAVLVRFGRMVDAAVRPGIHYALPFVERAHIRKVMRITRRSVATRDETGAVAFSMLSGDANLFEADVVLQFRIDDLGAYLYATANPEEILSLVVRERLIWMMGRQYIDLIFTSNRDIIQAQLSEYASAWLKANNIGIELLALTVVELRPVEETVAAFRDVSDAIAESIQAVSDAQRRSERLLARSRGQAEAVVANAKARAQERRLQAGASAQAFMDLVAAYRNRPASVTATRYWQRMRTIFRDATLSAVGPGEASEIDINMVDGFVPGVGRLPGMAAGAPDQRAVARSDLAGGRRTLTTASERGRHGFENVEVDRHLLSGRFHTTGGERHHLGTARPRSLIFDDLSIFGHRHVASSGVAAAAERNEPPLASGTAVEAEDEDDRGPAPAGKADKAGHAKTAGAAPVTKAGANPAAPAKTDEAQRKAGPGANGGKTDGPAE